MANPMTGSGVQQTREVFTEQTAAVVRNGKGGTRRSTGKGLPKRVPGLSGVDVKADVGGGATR